MTLRLRIVAYIAGWYLFSACLSLYNKKLVGRSHYNFPYPLLTSAIHCWLHWVVSALLFKVLCPGWFRAEPSRNRGQYRKVTGPLAIGNVNSIVIGKEKTSPTKDDGESPHSTLSMPGRSVRSMAPLASGVGSLVELYLTRLLPCGIATGLDIGFSNASLMYITLSFYTMCKSTVPMWCLLFAFILRLERPTASHIIVIAVIVIGAILTVAGEMEFDATGFALIMTAACCSGFRWALTQQLLHRSNMPAVLGMRHPVVTLYYLSPISCVTLFVIAWFVEGPFDGSQMGLATAKLSAQLSADLGNATAAVVHGSTPSAPAPFAIDLHTFTLMAGGGVLAYCMILCEYMLLTSSSVITMSIAGVFKEVVIIGAAVAVYGDAISPLNGLGVLVTVSGVLWYSLRMKRNTSEGRGVK